MLKKLTPTLVPGIPPVPKDASPELRAYLTALGEALQVRLGRRGDPRDRAVTLRELVDSGLAKQLKARTFDPNVINSSNIGEAMFLNGKKVKEFDKLLITTIIAFLSIKQRNFNKRVIGI